jgi:hypothetical protein
MTGGSAWEANGVKNGPDSENADETEPEQSFLTRKTYTDPCDRGEIVREEPFTTLTADQTFPEVPFLYDISEPIEEYPRDSQSGATGPQVRATEDHDARLFPPIVRNFGGDGTLARVVNNRVLTRNGEEAATAEQRT